MYLLNQQLICNADQFKHAVITVGGRVCAILDILLSAQYGDRLPDERLTHLLTATTAPGKMILRL